MYDQSSFSNSSTGRESFGTLHGRFRPVNDDAEPVTEMSLPYQAETGIAAFSSFGHGILEEGFLDDFMSVR